MTYSGAERQRATRAQRSCGNWLDAWRKVLPLEEEEVESKEVVYTVYPSLRDDIHEGYVWTNDSRVQEGTRPIVHIRHPDSNKSVYCEALYLGDSDVRYFNANDCCHQIDPKDQVILMNGWYRGRLGGIQPYQEKKLAITISRGPWSWFRVSLDHPQSLVRQSAWFGIIGTLLGVLGLAVGIPGLIK